MSDPRHRPSPSSSGGWPAARPAPRPVPPSPSLVRWRQLAQHPACQWQARGVRCVAEAVEVVVSRADVPRSSCEVHVLAWLRTGARQVAEPDV